MLYVVRIATIRGTDSTYRICGMFAYPTEDQSMYVPIL